jgi:mono/diheme cytochrome c family protein
MALKSLLIRLAIVGALVTAPLLIGMLFAYDIIKIEWISFMELQPSFRPQQDPLPMPERSVPVQGAYNFAGMEDAQNPLPASENSLARGKYFYDISCQPCHGATGQGNGPFAVYLTQVRPTNLTDEATRARSDGELFMIISNGIGVMPAMRQNIPDEDMRWSVVNYLRTLQEGQ